MTERGREEHEQNFVSAVIYVHDDEQAVAEFLRAVYAELSGTFLKFELVLVDDASTDGTADAIRAFAATAGGQAVSVLRMGYYQGLELAMNAGVDCAIGDYVYEFDSVALPYPPALIRAVYERSQAGYDIVAACPEHGGRPSSSLFYAVYNRFSGSQNRLRTESFRILSRRAINRVQGITRTLPYRKAVYANCGLRVDAVTYEDAAPPAPMRREEQRGRRRTAVDALILYTDVAYKASLLFSLLMVCATALGGGYAAAVYLTGRPVAGWTTTMLFLSFGFFGMGLILTVAIKYAALILKTVFTRQKYIVESIEKLT